MAMSKKEEQEMRRNIPNDQEDIEVNDPITKEKMTVEGEHYDLNRDIAKKNKELLTDGNGNVLSDRVVSELVRTYCSYPETYNGLKKGEFKTWEDNTGLTCELQEYRGDKEDEYQEIRVSYNTKLYKDVIQRLREAKKKGNL